MALHAGVCSKEDERAPPCTLARVLGFGRLNQTELPEVHMKFLRVRMCVALSRAQEATKRNGGEMKKEEKESTAIMALRAY